MSVATLSRSGMAGNRSRRTDPPLWTRPSDWLALPAVNVGDKKFVGLYAIYEGDSNFVAFTAAGAFTVDWGDGSAVENIGTGAQAQHNYSFAAISAGTLTSGGYKQVIITVTPQGAGNLTALNLNTKHNQSNLAVGTMSGWLDIRMASAAMSNLAISATGVPQAAHRGLQSFEYVGPSSLVANGPIFYGCSALQSVIGTEWCATMTSFLNMFVNCVSLPSVPLLNTAAGTNFSSMFLACISLRSVPLLNTALGTDFSSMFDTCYSLSTIPAFNTAAGTNFSGMFNGCRVLQSVPLLNTALGTNFSSMFAGCSFLRSIPLLNTALGTNFSSMFNATYVKTIPLLNTAAGTNFSSMFASCQALQSVPLLNTGAGTNFASMFQSCLALPTIPLLNTAAGTNFSAMFNGCSALVAIPLLNVAAGASAANFNNMFNSCLSLSVGALSGGRFAISYLSCRLSATELNRIYTNLGVASGAQAITVSSNYGVAGDDPTIATAKGWTVTGS